MPIIYIPSGRAGEYAELAAKAHGCGIAECEEDNGCGFEKDLFKGARA